MNISENLRVCFGSRKLVKKLESAYLIVDQNKKDNADKYFGIDRFLSDSGYRDKLLKKLLTHKESANTV